PDPADPGQDRVVLVVASGANRVNPAKAACAGGMALRRADAAWVREATGFAIGGVAPLGHLAPPVVLVDRDLAAFDRLWAAAGSPTHVFATTPDELLRISGGAWAVVREG
ncbi:MAG: YbaK/EbsC family protein, partial [Acetobacteraceae bacterium]|nr:YbaK/EbsC family protein [Acetobacteraceae bacterium]